MPAFIAHSTQSSVFPSLNSNSSGERLSEDAFAIDSEHGLLHAAPGAVPAHFALLLHEADAQKWALIRAADPYSLRLSSEGNRDRFAGLANYLSQQGHRFITVKSRCGGRWVKAALVFDIDRDEALAIGRSFAQRTILYGNENECRSVESRGLDFCI